MSDVKNYFYGKLARMVEDSLIARHVRFNSKRLGNMMDSDLESVILGFCLNNFTSDFDEDMTNSRYTVDTLSLEKRMCKIIYVYLDVKFYTDKIYSGDYVFNLTYKDVNTIIIFRNNIELMMDANVSDEEIYNMVIKELSSIISLCEPYPINVEKRVYSIFTILGKALHIELDTLLKLIEARKEDCNIHLVKSNFMPHELDISINDKLSINNVIGSNIMSRVMKMIYEEDGLTVSDLFDLGWINVVISSTLHDLKKEEKNDDNKSK